MGTPREFEECGSLYCISKDEDIVYSLVQLAEEPLPAGGSCLLGSINLAEFVNEKGEFDEYEFRNCAYTATFALNYVLEEGLLLHPLQEQRDSVKAWRQIGLGIMGLADCLIKMGIRYGSEKAVEFSKYVSKNMLYEALAASRALSKKRGSFEKYDYNKTSNSEMFKNLELTSKNLIKEDGLRNSQLLTIAPTGSLSTMIGVSGGIEPIFANYYMRKTESLHGEDVYYKVYTPIVEKYMKEHNLKDDSELPDFFVTARDLDYHERIDMQAAWQENIDASISSTVNLPYETTPEEVFDLYMYAWEKGLKGVTVFRDGCRRAPILSTKKDKKEEPKLEQKSDLNRGEVIPASDSVVGKKRKLQTGCGSLHIAAFFDNVTGELRETYLSKGSTGGCNNFMIGLSRMISLSARAGVDVHDIVDQLNSCGVCPSYAVRRATKNDTSKGSCCPIAIGNALIEMWEEMQNELARSNDSSSTNIERVLPNTSKDKIDKQCDGDSGSASDNRNTYGMCSEINFSSNKGIVTCPFCGTELVHEGGCNICKNCGWTKCE